MNTATHKSKDGKWLYKRSKRQLPQYEQTILKKRLMMFWDAHCSKWRESVVDEQNTVEITGEL